MFEIYRTEGGRLWKPGSKAKGALWFPNNEHERDQYTLFLCEGETDALAAVQSGCPWVVACSPGAAMTSATLEDFCRIHDYERVVCAFDNDDAGNKGAALVVEHAGEYPVVRFAPGGTGSDLREYLLGDQPRVMEADWTKIEASFEDIAPVAVPRPEPVGIRLPTFSRPFGGDQKPDLLSVWQQIAPRLPNRPARKDSQGRVIREAFCPLHDDGKTPGAWVGQERWGCWVCGIDSADVYELVAWHRGVCPAGSKLSGQDFARAKELTRAIVGGP